MREREQEFTVKAVIRDGYEGVAMVLMQQWISSKRGGRTFELTCGAGLGNGLLRATAADGDRTVIAEIDIRRLAQDLWLALEVDLDKAVSDG